MKKELVIITTALVWGLVIYACSVALKDMGAFQHIQLILGEGALVSLLIVTTAGVRKKS